MSRRIRVGVIGLRRGLTLAKAMQEAGGEVVAVCDRDEDLVAGAVREIGGSGATDTTAFEQTAMDAVVLANDFDQHAPLAMRFLGSGRHVLSETTACWTLAEGVALVEAVESSGCTYMLAENYAFQLPVLEMRRRFVDGVLGTFQYGEAEYIHPLPPEVAAGWADDPDHWRARLPPTYYCTHSLAPLLHITGAEPIAVSGYLIESQEHKALASVLMVRMAGGALARAVQGNLRGEQWSSVRIHGSSALIENVRAAHSAEVRLRFEPWDVPEGESADQAFAPVVPPLLEGRPRLGPGGVDVLVADAFLHAVDTGTTPPLDVYQAVTMSAIGIQGMRSVLKGSATWPVPNFGSFDDRAVARHDDWVPTLGASGRWG